MLALLLALAPALPPQGAIETRALECGVTLTLLRVPGASACQGSLLAPAGPTRERADQVGLSSVVVDSLAGGGSEERDRESIDAWLAEQGAEINLARAQRSLALDFQGPPGALEGLLVLGRELFERPAHGGDALEAARRRLLDSMAGRGSDLAQRATWELAFGARVRPARVPHREDVLAFERADLIAFHRANLAAEDLHVVLTGALPADVAELVDRVFADYPRRAAAAPEPVRTFRTPAPAEGPHIVVLDLADARGAQRAELRVAVASVPRGHPDAPALQLFARYHDVLRHRGGSPAGPEQLLAAARVVFTFDDLLVASLALPARDAAEGLQVLLAALRPGAEWAPDADELRSAREGLLRIYEHEDALTRARNHALALMAGRDPGDAAAHVRGLSSSGPDEIRAALEQRRAGGVVVVAAGDADALVAVLAELGTVEVRTGLRQPRGTEAGLDLAERMLAALGGGHAWAELDALDCQGEVRIAGLDQPVAVTVRRDLAAGATRIEQLNLATISTPEGAWSRSASAYNELPEAAHARLQFAEERQLFRLARALARGRGVRVGVSTGGALECWRGDLLLAWIELDADGRPLRLGYDDPDGAPAVVEFGDWAPVAGLWLPGRTRTPTRGSEHVWARYEVAPEHDPGLFVRPVR